MINGVLTDTRYRCPNSTCNSTHGVRTYMKLTQHCQCDIDCFHPILIVSLQSVDTTVPDLYILAEGQLDIPGVGVIRVKRVGDGLGSHIDVVSRLWGVHPTDVGGGVSSDDTPQGHGTPRSY